MEMAQVVVVLLDKTKGMEDAVEDHFILKRRRKKKATQSKSLFTSFYPLLDKEDKWKAPIGWLFSLEGFVVVVDLFGWIGGRGMHTHD